MKNKILITKSRKILIPESSSGSKNNFTIVATIVKNIEHLGFTFSEDVIEGLLKCSKTNLVHFYNETVDILRDSVGAHVLHLPMYPNFPQQVMEMSDAELYINAIIHYASAFLKDCNIIDNTLLPKYKREHRYDLIGNYDLKLIDIGTEQDLCDIFTSLLSANTSISEFDEDVIKYLFHNIDNISQYIPNDVPQRERKSLLYALFIENGTKPPINGKITATDILRTAVTMSGGDISLASATKFKSFRRKERRLLLEMLESIEINSMAEDMLRWKKRWIRLGERLHPGDYACQCPNVYKVFQSIRNNTKDFTTFNSKVENCKDVGELVDMLKKRPGEFARKLNYVLSTITDHFNGCQNIPAGVNKENTVIDFCNLVIEEFASVADKVATPVLLQLYAFFKNYYSMVDNEFRFFYPKGNVAKVKVIKNNMSILKMPTVYKVRITISDELKRRFSKSGLIGNKKIFIDKDLENYIIPHSQRSASNSLQNLVRGTKVDIGSKNYLRFFTYWKNINCSDRVDLDLSAVAYDENMNYVKHISYTQLCDKQIKAYHSGDITDAPHGASEFIDIDIDNAISKKCRYIVMMVLSYTSQPFNIIPTAFAGWITRDDMNSGEIFEPKTVINKFELNAPTRVSIPVVFDLIEKKAIWGDLGLKKTSGANNIESNEDNIILMVKSLLQNKKMNVYDLIKLHAQDAEIVNDIKDADLVFTSFLSNFEVDSEKVIRPTDFEKITKFME